MKTWLDSSTLSAPVKIYPTEHQFIESFLLGPNFPWFWQSSQTFNNFDNFPDWLKPIIDQKNCPYLSHILLARTEDPKIGHQDRASSEFSPYYEFFVEIFHRWMNEHNLKYKTIYRVNLNLNWYNGEHHSEPHKDHVFPHSNFIMYLNTCDAGETIIWPDDFSASYMIPCQQYHAVTFKEQYHAHRYPAPGQRRVVLVITYI